MEEGDEDKPTTYEMPETMIGTFMILFGLHKVIHFTNKEIEFQRD